MDLIEILYGKNNGNKFKKGLIAKNYLYFYYKEINGITINRFTENRIKTKKECFIMILFK